MKRKFFVCLLLLFPATAFCNIPSGWPVKGEITSGFGPRRHPITRRWRNHNGIDIRVKIGTPVRATCNGEVTSAGWQNNGVGKSIVISHGNGFSTRYGHLERIKVKEGEWVKKGETIGYSGNSGRSTGPHLYYEVKKDGKAQNPTQYLEGEIQIAYSKEIPLKKREKKIRKEGKKEYETFRIGPEYKIKKVIYVKGKKSIKWKAFGCVWIVAKEIRIEKLPYSGPGNWKMQVKEI